MKPYYEDSGITIYNADCREVLPLLSDGVFITDPPYGVNFEYDTFVDDDASWTSTLSVLCSLVGAMPSAVCMSFARLWELPPAKWAAAWFKPGSVRRSKIGGWATWEPILLYGKGWKIANDMKRLPDCQNHSEGNSHPCPKPVELFKWLINGAPDGTVVDPFMGSGTTLLAAKLEGRKAIGVELSERYCEIAARRLSQGVLFGVTA